MVPARFQDRVAIVRDSRRGICEEIAARFAREGAKVVVNDIDLINLENAVKRLHDGVQVMV